MSDAKIGFEMRKIRLPLENILPVRQMKDPQKRVDRYNTILLSFKEVGLVEPLVVHPQKDVPGKYLLLDGHLRFFALKELGETSADCIIANDDECFTYNARISRLPPIQEHKMIIKAVRNGVRPERIAAALNIPVRVVLASMRLLDGIHEEEAPTATADLANRVEIGPIATQVLHEADGQQPGSLAGLVYLVQWVGYGEPGNTYSLPF